MARPRRRSRGHRRCPSGWAGARRVGGSARASARGRTGSVGCARGAGQPAGRRPGRRTPSPRACSRSGRPPATSGRWRRRRPFRRRSPSGTGCRSGGRSARRRAAACSRRVTIARASIAPRGERTVSQPPCSIPRSAASSGLSSTNISGCSSLSQLVEPAHRPAEVMLGQPERAWRRSGYSVRRRVVDRLSGPSKYRTVGLSFCFGIEQVARPATRPARSASGTGRPSLAGREQPADAVGLHDERLRRRRSRPCPWRPAAAGSRAACRAGSRARRRRPTSAAARPTR